MGNPRSVTAFVFLIISFHLYGQQPSPVDTPVYFNRILDANQRYYQSNDTLWISSGFCKVLKIQMLTGIKAKAYLDEQQSVAKRIPFLTVHGTVQYDFTYRSFVDTPFSQRDFAQHSIQATLDITVRDQYPIRLVIGTRRNNSPYFDNVTDVNLQFNRSTFLNSIKDKLNKQLSLAMPGNKLSDIEKLYHQKKWEVESLQGWLSNSARLQAIIEEKERLEAKKVNANRQLPGIEDLKNKIPGRDSLLKPDLLTQYERKKDSLEKALKQLQTYEQKVISTKKSAQDSIANLRKQLARITDPATLKEFIRQHNLDAKDLPKGWKALSIINTIGLGRTWVDYSDLTVKNISLTGINAELTPGRFYLAFAAGKVNYRYRDFVINSNDRSRQSLYLLRAGIGKKEGNNFILTWYDGKKNLLNSFNNPAATGMLERVIGVSAESRLQIDANNYIVLEAAKSSFHNVGTVNQGREGLMGKVWNFKDRSNEAYSIKVSSTWPQTRTKVIGFYRKMGEHFQSFNLQPINVDQEAYHVKVQQSFWKNKLVVDAGIRKNDFSNPFINPGLNSKTVFKSLQATLRVRKYPFVSLGYYPSSQLTVLDNNVIVENQYNTLSTVAGYSYRIKNTGMSTNAVFLKFYNSGADTGFIYYNATSWTVNQYVFLNKIQLQSGFTYTSQRELKVTTLEQSVSWQVRQWVALNGGLKYNHVNQAEVLWGSTAGLTLIIKNMGTIQASYDKSYLPGLYRNLLPVDMGRLTYYKTF